MSPEPHKNRETSKDMEPVDFTEQLRGTLTTAEHDVDVRVVIAGLERVVDEAGEHARGAADRHLHLQRAIVRRAARAGHAEADARTVGLAQLGARGLDERGRVVSPKIQSSTDSVFDRPTLDAIKKWKFEPGKRGGKSVRSRMRIPITYPK